MGLGFYAIVVMVNSGVLNSLAINGHAEPWNPSLFSLPLPLKSHIIGEICAQAIAKIQ